MSMFRANPIFVEAFKITEVAPGDEHGGFPVLLENGEEEDVSPQMAARHIPVVGDYWVIQGDGYVYINPKEVFERKYSPAPDDEQSAPNQADSATTANAGAA